MDDSFAALVDRTAREAGLNDYQLSGAIGLLPSKRIYSPKQVGRLRRNQVRHVDRELVDRLIDVLGLDPFEAYEAADLRPEGFTAEDHRTFAAVGGTTTPDQPEPFTSRFLAFPGQRVRPQGRRAGRLPLVLHGGPARPVRRRRSARLPGTHDLARTGGWGH